MHRDRNNGTWPELKAKRHEKFDNAPQDSLNVMHKYLNDESHDTQKAKKDRAEKLLNRVQTMFKDMADYEDKKR